ncbi:MAG: xanthan lyase [Bacteroidaceae bacterium]|nr:xanthan lyase [Bacteroidaceae bacterium]
MNNILSVAKYESKLLKRSWFFKVFSTLSVLLIGGASVGILQMHKYALSCIPSLAAYNLMLYFNVAQAIVSIFLASEYLKRDKQLDTSEVFYVRPLSNAEYLLGKMWGTIQVFLLLNLVVMAVALTICYINIPEYVSPVSFIVYFLILNVPTLIYIIGLSTLMMLIVKNQALTFVILLGYIGLTLFYVGDKCYYLFDYIGFNIPLLESTITGFADLPSLIVHRLLYLLLGIGFILCSISLFRRLPNSPRALYPWRAASVVFLVGALACATYHVGKYLEKENFQQEMVTLNNRHASEPKMEMDSCLMEVEQRGDVLHIKAQIVATPAKTSAKQFTFTLNPGFEIKSATMDGTILDYRRKKHLLWIDFPQEIAEKETVRFTLEYEGVADERICYLDIPEELLIEQEKFMGTFNVGKRYVYQSEEYTLLTPESYWYPRPGVCYSNENPDWQQSYFTSFRLNVKPNEGLTVLSQGERSMGNDSVTVSFKPEYPLQSLTLIIGNYKEISTVVDNTQYSAWYLDGHDFFTQELTLINDTIPSIIRDVRFNYEELVGMEFPFNRFSIVETPAHFASYSRAWTGAQEKMQPEMVLVPERMYNNWRFDIKGHKERRKADRERGGRRGGGRGRRGGQTMTDLEIEMQIFRDILYFMWDTNASVDWQSGQMGRSTVTVKESPYYIFPQMYNFRYNIYSTEWPVANRMVELMLQGNEQRNNWMRNINGLSNDEKSLMLMQRYSFKEIQNLTEHRDLLNNLIKLQGKKLFLDAERNMGVQAFQDTLFAHVKRNAFRNLSFESLLDTLEVISHTNLRNQLEDWNRPTELTEFMIGTPSVTKMQTETMEIYQAEIIISNLSDQAGSINMRLQFWSQDGNTDYQIFNGEEKPVEWIVDFKPHETKRIVTHWEENPGTFIINTLFSKNLPVLVNARNQRVEEVYILTEEGEYSLSEEYMKNKEEVVVDNEDAHLFSLSTPPPSGYLGEWINSNSEEEEFKYVGVNEWRAPARWTSSTDQNHYGQSIRSAVFIRSGKGDQYAQWKIPVPHAGRYELYYHVRRPEQLRRENRWGRKKYYYNFIVSSEADEYEEKAELNMRRADDGWNLVGTYGLTGDTLIVRLTDESELRMITADAVKLVKKN